MNGGGENNIIEYDIAGDYYTQSVGMMKRSRRRHAVTVVPYEDFSKWCKYMPAI